MERVFTKEEIVNLLDIVIRGLDEFEASIKDIRNKIDEFDFRRQK